MPPAAAPFKLGSVGQPLPGTTVLIQREDGSTAEPNEPGEIVVQGPTVFAGYLNRPDDRALRGGRLYTGDLGYVDADGDLFVLQRRTDLIVSGGENIYPAEVEAVLRGHAAVADVCVVGVPHALWGQQVAAAVVPNPAAPLDEAELQAWCRARLAGYKIPRRFRVVDALPMTASGKVIRRAVSDLFE
jgi:O-succinylbenzoic acid--CoA ligase